MASNEKDKMKELLEAATTGDLKHNKNYKKLLKKIHNDPKLAELVANAQKNAPPPVKLGGDMTLRDRLHARIKQKRTMRDGQTRSLTREKNKDGSGSSLPQTISNLPNPPSSSKNGSEGVKTPQLHQERILKEVSLRNKEHREKLKRLQKKYGTISFEQYTQSIQIISKLDTLPDVITHHRKLIELYLKQHPIVEQKIIDEDSEIENIVEDLPDLDINN